MAISKKAKLRTLPKAETAEIKGLDDFDSFGDEGRTFEEIFNDESISVDERIIKCVHEALDQLSLVRAVVNTEDVFKIEGHTLNGVTYILNNAYSTLMKASALHGSTH